jgi:hypothetical protein
MGEGRLQRVHIQSCDENHAVRLPTIITYSYLLLPTIITYYYLLPTIITYYYLLLLPTIISYYYYLLLPTIINYYYLLLLPTTKDPLRWDLNMVLHVVRILFFSEHS